MQGCGKTFYVFVHKILSRENWDYSFFPESLILSWQVSLSYRNQSINLLWKSMDWFLYDRNSHYERVKGILMICCKSYGIWLQMLVHHYQNYLRAKLSMAQFLVRLILKVNLHILQYVMNFASLLERVKQAAALPGKVTNCECYFGCVKDVCEFLWVRILRQKVDSNKYSLQNSVLFNIQVHITIRYS